MRLESSAARKERMTLPDPGGERGRAADSFLTTEEVPHLWSGLYESVRDRFFPPNLPPLELTSTPVPVTDRMASNTNPWAVGTATLVNGGILALLLLMGVKAVVHGDPFPKSGPSFHIDNFPLFAPMRADSLHGGRGGGTNDLIDPNKGRPPKIDMNAIEKVQVPLLDHPKLPLDNRIAAPPEVTLPDNPTMPLIGLHNSTNVTVVSSGPGKNGGIGFGPDGSFGPGSGSGWGPDSGTGTYRPGVGGVSQPVPIFTPEAEFSDEARRQKYEGVCLISVIIDAQGNPQSPRVVRALGMGLDEKALQAVMKYRFKPARKDGKPVAVRISVMVNFRLF
jgi:periplasmic protein TonB